MDMNYTESQGFFDIKKKPYPRPSLINTDYSLNDSINRTFQANSNLGSPRFKSSLITGMNPSLLKTQMSLKEGSPMQVKGVSHGSRQDSMSNIVLPLPGPIGPPYQSPTMIDSSIQVKQK